MDPPLMTGYLRKTLIPLAVGSVAIVGTALPASASTQTQDGLVNVAVGDITIVDAADVAVAAQVAANVCGVNVGPVTALATTVDATGVAQAVCTTAQGPITITQ